MKKIFSSSQIIGPFKNKEEDFEACATAEAQFDESQSRMTVELDSFIRPIDLRSKEHHLQAAWLPKKTNVQEAVSAEEATEVAKDIFRRWVRMVHQAMPSQANN